MGLSTDTSYSPSPRDFLPGRPYRLDSASVPSGSIASREDESRRVCLLFLLTSSPARYMRSRYSRKASNSRPWTRSLSMRDALCTRSTQWRQYRMWSSSTLYGVWKSTPHSWHIRSLSVGVWSGGAPRRARRILRFATVLDLEYGHELTTAPTVLAV